MSKKNAPPKGATPSPDILALLICPITQARLKYDARAGELISEKAKLAYPIRDGIPVMLAREARKL